MPGLRSFLACRYSYSKLIFADWKAAFLSHLDYIESNICAIIALGDGRMYSLMWLLFFQARAYLHREYLPFTPKEGYDPSTGMIIVHKYNRLAETRLLIAAARTLRRTAASMH
jgi:hypothetical protein